MKLSLPAPSKNVVSLFELLVRNKNKPNFELRVGERVWAVLLSDMYPISLKYRINSVLAWVQAPRWGKKEKNRRWQKRNRRAKRPERLSEEGKGSLADIFPI